MNRTDILNRLAAVCGLERYLEIGVRNPASNFDHITCLARTGVDRRFNFLPLPHDSSRVWELFHMTSDEFFARYPDRQFDLVFVDGNHMAPFVRRDVANALRAIGNNSRARVVMHDCNPPDEHHTHGSLCGTAYQVFLECRADPLLDCYCVDCDYGVGVIRRRSDSPAVQQWLKSLEQQFDDAKAPPPGEEFARFAQYRKEWLNLIDPKDWNPT